MSGLQAIESWRTDANEIQDNIINKQNSRCKAFSLFWVPGHSRIYGNEQADMLARSAAKLEGAWNFRRHLQLSLGCKIISLSPVAKSLGQLQSSHHLPYIANAFPPQCITCHNILSIDHILLHCVRYREARRSLTAFCEVRRLPMTQITLLGDQHPDLVDSLMIFLAETNLINEL